MTTLSDPQALAELYVSVWNEPDPERRRRIVRALWPPNGRHFVRLREVRGYDELDERVTTSHEKNVTIGGCFFRPFDVQALQDVVAFHWEMVSTATGEVESAGFEFLVLADDGRIATDYQFILS